MSLAGVFDKLGQTVMPTIAASVFPDTMTIKGETTVVGSGGGIIKSAASDIYEDVPCTYEPTQVENRLTSGDKLISIQQYLVTFPTHDAQQFRLDIDPKAHLLVVNERGSEPEKTFRIVALRDISGVVFEALCNKEN